MDVLSSQSNLAGYKAVLLGSDYMTRAFPLMMTAAGTITPAKILIFGVGAVSYTHLRAHETVLDLVCRLLLYKKKKKTHDDSI